MFASIVVTLLVVPGVLLLLLNAALTGGFAGKAPTGQNAAGLVVPFFMAIIGSVLLLIATWVCLAKGGLSWIQVASIPAGVIATLVAIFVGVAATGVLIAWAERMGAWVAPAGLLGGALGPALLGALLLASAWNTPEAIGGSPLAKIAGGALGLAALLGMGLGGVGTFKYVKHSNENAKRVLAEHVAFEEKWARKRARTPMEALREDYAEMSPDSPLWVFVAALPDRNEADCRAFIIERSLKVPNFDAELGSTMTDDHPRYRHGCLDLIRFAPREAVKPEWADPAARAIRLSAEQIRKKPEWLTPDEFSNPDPASHIRAMVDVAARFGDDPNLAEALTELRRAVEAAPESGDREAALESLGATNAR